MNTTEHEVTKVLSDPYHRYLLWCVDVEADSRGNVQKTTLYFETKEEADAVTVGFRCEQ